MNGHINKSWNVVYHSRLRVWFKGPPNEDRVNCLDSQDAALFRQFMPLNAIKTNGICKIANDTNMSSAVTSLSNLVTFYPIRMKRIYTGWKIDGWARLDFRQRWAMYAGEFRNSKVLQIWNAPLSDSSQGNLLVIISYMFAMLFTYEYFSNNPSADVQKYIIQWTLDFLSDIIVRFIKKR